LLSFFGGDAAGQEIPAELSFSDVSRMHFQPSRGQTMECLVSVVWTRFFRNLSLMAVFKGLKRWIQMKVNHEQLPNDHRKSCLLRWVCPFWFEPRFLVAKKFSSLSCTSDRW
jgi:hypothetical protein